MARARRSGVQFVREEELALETVPFEVKRAPTGLRGRRTSAETEKEKDEQSEKARAAAWAWYQHGKGGKESLSRSRTLSTGEAKVIARSGELGLKSSRFKIEAVKSSGHSDSAAAESQLHRRRQSGTGWDTSNSSMTGTSSLFDAYEIGYVSKRIETAVHGYGSTSPTSASRLSTLRPGFYVVHQGERPAAGRPPRKRRTGTPAGFAPEVITMPESSQETTSSPKLTRSSTFRLQFPRYICSSLNDIVTHEEMTRSVDMGKGDCQTTQATTSPSDLSGWSLRRSSRVHSVPKA